MNVRSKNVKSKDVKSKADASPQADDTSQPQEEPERENLLVVVDRMVRPWLASTLAHLALIILLAVMTLSLTPEKTISLNSSVSEEPSTVMEPIQIADLEVTEFEEMSAEAPNIDSDLLTEALSPVEVSAVSDMGAFSDMMGAMDGLGDDLSELSEVAVSAKTTFMGTESTGGRFIFLVDNSASMGRGKFETALAGLVDAVSKLNEQQYFYVIFYSDTAYPLFYPQTASKLVPATDSNKKRLQYWLSTIPMCLRTNASEAIEIAKQLEPDVIYILGDGAFTDKADMKLINNPLKGVTIHTLGMEVSNKKNAANQFKGFKAIAKAHEGTYNDVGITPIGLEILKLDGERPKFKTRTGIWGLKLPAK